MKPFSVVECEQRSPEWVAARLGRVTSSVAGEMLATRRDGNEAADRANLRVRLALERITGRSQESAFLSKAMQDGIDREADGLAEYEALTGTFVSKCGFLSHTTLMAGASLDGYLGDYEALVEVKSPYAATHFEYLQTGKVPVRYYRQAIHQLWCTGASFCDWVSFQPDFPDPLRLKVVRIVRNETEMAAHELNVRNFLSEVDRVVAAIDALRNGQAA